MRLHARCKRAREDRVSEGRRMTFRSPVKTIAEQFARDGYYAPVPVLTEEETQKYRAEFDDFYRRNKDRLVALPAREHAPILSETHTSFEWVYRIAAHPRVLDVVESILGPNLLIWGSRWFSKMPGDKTYISWHQDGAYWGLHPPNVVTAWVALSESTSENGCMRVVPKTHLGGALPQVETYAPDNALSRGQEIAVEVNEAEAVNLTLQPGEMSLHHIGIVHGSKVNTSDKPRIGIAVRFITPEVVQDGVEHPYAMLVRGADDQRHFEHAPIPTGNQPGLQAKAVERMLSSVLPRR
jgi:non-haem Fe2+, alpha-ketoglutarate-dependent halogenase